MSAFLLDGKKNALTPGTMTPVSSSKVNNGNSLDASSMRSDPACFVSDSDATRDIQYHGFPRAAG